MKSVFFGKVVGLSSAIAFISGCQSIGAFDPNKLPPTATVPEVSEPGKVEVRYFDNISGNSIRSLTSSSRFPSNPSNVTAINSLEVRNNRGDNYGTLVRGFIKPPTSGRYRFFVSGDDQVQLWLSSSDQEGSAKLIASATGWTAVNQYNKYSSQTSPYQTLDANKQYYFEIRHKEGNSDDHFSVAWEGPGISRSVIGSNAIATWAQSPASGSGSQDKSVSYAPGYSAGFQDGSEGLPFNPVFSSNEQDQEAYALGYSVGYLDGSEDLPFNPAYPPLDKDNDGIYDNWEIVHGLDPNDPDDARTDPDGDLLSAADEFLIGTHENNPDTDGDGIPDGMEVAFGLNPLDPKDAAEDMDGDGYSNLEEYLAGTKLDDPNSSPDIAPGASQKGEQVSGFAGQYFQGSSFNTFVLAKTDPSINFDWGTDKPIPELPADHFSVRWSGTFTAPHSNGRNNYEFITRTNDGARLYRDGQRVINDWQEAATRDNKYTTTLAAGESVNLTMENFEGTGNAFAKLTIRNTTTNQTVDTAKAVTSPSLVSPGTGGDDTDGDGIPDAWELAYGLNVYVDDASGVSNNNGISNIEAYESGLHPWTLAEVSKPSTSNKPGSSNKPSPPPPVTPPSSSTGSATLSWTAPSTRLDGSSISRSDIKNYEIRYGNDRNNMNRKVTVDGGKTSHVISDLHSGTWYFSVTVFDSNSRSSAASAVVSKSIR